MLTKDITTLESIYDLIDNSIDAARDKLLSRPPVSTDKYGLPADYSGYRIALRFASDSISLLDNCSGIDQNTLINRAFVTGSLSSHSYGIGHFGIGLKRALLRLGKSYAISTDTGDFAAKLRFSDGNEGNLEAIRGPSSGSPKMLVRVSDLRTSVRQELTGGAWKTSVLRSLSRRYGLYIAKGLQITVQGSRVEPFGPQFRRTGPVATQASHFDLPDGGEAFIDAGMHEGYHLTDEPGYDKKRIADLTDQYGWYFVCNDRIIRIATHEPELGWTANWHQEYYGFVGWVRFVSEDAELLPWDTKKSSIDTSSAAFRAIQGKLQAFADAYKTEGRKARKERPTDSESPSKPKDGKKGKRGSSGKPSDSTGTPSEERPEAEDHNEHWSTLLPDLTVELDHPKVRALAYEARKLQIEHCYSGAMLFRSLIETALFENIKKAGRYSEVRESVFAEQAASGRPFDDAQKKGFRPTFRHALDWLNKQDDYFPDEVRRECVNARTKFGKHLRELNGVVHEGDLIDSGKLKIVRNDTLPLLRFLLLAPKRNS
ncbi:ATP-binding protein [Caulobacter flavus]|uniref:ATP-binding protein n=1 Tax=Caulobacter flavus TaxID=1679497 RepID=UPI0013DDED8C|nr:ATP-binding protein [Caulobacter flavus]